MVGATGAWPRPPPRAAAWPATSLWTPRAATPACAVCWAARSFPRRSGLLCAGAAMQLPAPSRHARGAMSLFPCLDSHPARYSFRQRKAYIKPLSGDLSLRPETSFVAESPPDPLRWRSSDVGVRRNRFGKEELSPFSGLTAVRSKVISPGNHRGA